MGTQMYSLQKTLAKLTDTFLTSTELNAEVDKTAQQTSNIHSVMEKATVKLTQLVTYS